MCLYTTRHTTSDPKTDKANDDSGFTDHATPRESTANYYPSMYAVSKVDRTTKYFGSTSMGPHMQTQTDCHIAWSHPGGTPHNYSQQCHSKPSRIWSLFLGYMVPATSMEWRRPSTNCTDTSEAAIM